MTQEQKAVTPMQQREIEFYGDEIVAVQTVDGDVVVPVRPICELIGVAWPPQYNRIKRDLILSEEATVVTVTITTAGATQTQSREMVALPLKYLNGWLFGMNASRVKPEIKERLLRYQRECYDVLYEAFFENKVTARPDPLVDELLRGDSAEARAYQMAMAIANMAREQLLMRQRVESAESILTKHEQRLQILEAGQGDDSRFISENQAVEISQAVKTIANELTKRSGRNQFGSVYGELYRRMEVTSYKRLPAPQFDEAMDFLRQWWQSLTDQSGVPF